jgi:hypothetical protein
VVPDTGTAITRTPSCCSATVASASVWPRLGSCERASPNQAMIFVLFCRNPMLPPAATW